MSNISRDYEWFALGPENIGGRITDLAYDAAEPSIIYIAAASGGIYKTIFELQNPKTQVNN